MEFPSSPRRRGPIDFRQATLDPRPGKARSILSPSKSGDDGLRERRRVFIEDYRDT